MADRDVAEQGAGGTSAIRALREDDSSRKRFFTMAGAGAAGAFAMFVAACGGDDEEKNGSTGGGKQETTPKKAGGDLDILNYALTLEYLEADFYAKVIEAGIVSDPKIGALAKQFGDTERQHVEALTATIKKLGGTPAKQPRTKFPLEDEMKVLELAATVENLGAAAYLSEAGKIQNKEVLAAALSIHSVEARHAAALNRALGKRSTPDGAFAKPASRDEVLKAVKPFIAS